MGSQDTLRQPTWKKTLFAVQGSMFGFQEIWRFPVCISLGWHGCALRVVRYLRQRERPRRTLENFDLNTRSFILNRIRKKIRLLIFSSPETLLTIVNVLSVSRDNLVSKGKTFKVNTFSISQKQNEVRQELFKVKVSYNFFRDWRDG